MRHVEQLGQVYRALRAMVRQQGAALTARPVQQLFALMAIRDEGVRTQVALAERMLIDPPAASRLVDRLVADGLLERCSGPDRRCVKLVTTRAADREIALAHKLLDRVEADLLGRLTPAEARTFRKLLAKVAGEPAEAAAPGA